MATNQSSFTTTRQERRAILGRAKKLGLSFSNYVRRQLGLEPLKHGGLRQSKQSDGSHAYRIGKYEVIAMADNRWHLFIDGEDIGRDYKRLTDARRAIHIEERKKAEQPTEVEK